MNTLLGEHLAGRADHGNRLWLLLNSEVWYRMYIQGATADDVIAEIATCVKVSPVRTTTAASVTPLVVPAGPSDKNCG
jgi:hypothetical protein